ncbi:MAG: hypothetical protein J6Y01_06015 [Spirochaetales bacterium]|nr:hypothetical protein [Spirochaetales bacterium]
MAAIALKQKVIDYVAFLDDDSTKLLLAVAQALAFAKKDTVANSKTLHQRQEAEQAYSELEQMNFQLKDEISLDGRSERAASLWRKYDSLS